MNASENATTGTTPYRFLYGRDPKSVFAENLTELDFLADREKLRAEAADAVSLAQAKTKLLYDSKYTVPVFNTGWAYLKLAKTGDTGYHLQNQTKLSARKIGPFLILEVNPLLCKLDLPDWLGGPCGIYPVISVQYLEPAKPDLYNRK
jgi:hypothetical protein